MNKLEFIPYKPGHLSLMKIKPEEMDTLGENRLEAVCEIGSCDTVMFDGRILFIAGMYWLWPGVAEVFIIPSEYVTAETSISFVRAALRFLTDDRLKDAHRLQTSSRSNPTTDRWMKLLGFKCEGTLLKYSQHKEDYKMWARVNHGS